MPSLADAPFLHNISTSKEAFMASINALSGWCSISTEIKMYGVTRRYIDVSMPSLADAPFLRDPSWPVSTNIRKKYQCPLGLMLHFYVSDVLRKIYSWADCINALSGWCSISTRFKLRIYKNLELYQCPFGLMLHFYHGRIKKRSTERIRRINALSGWCSISTLKRIFALFIDNDCINALSGWCSISTLRLRSCLDHA